MVKMKKRFIQTIQQIALAVVFMLNVSGCGTGAAQQKQNPEKREQQSRVTAGDDQHVRVQTPVTLAASFTDHRLDIRKYRWTEYNLSVNKQERFTLEGLVPGVHRFRVVAEDKFGRTYSDTVHITVKGEGDTNSDPIAEDISLTVMEDASGKGAFRGSDSDGDPLTYLLVSLPRHGTLSGSSAGFVYTPDPDFNGIDTFLYKLNDGKIDSNLATVTIDVTPVNDAPVARDISLQIPDGNVTPITLQAEDIDSDTLVYAIEENPAHGTLLQEGEKIIYTPESGYSGMDSFRYRVHDGSVDSNIATVTIEIHAANRLPVAYGQSVSTIEDQALSIVLDASDPDGDALTYHYTQPAHGTVSGTGQHITYVPESGFVGSDTFLFRVNDGTGDSVEATITVNVAVKPNTPPVAAAQQLTLDEDQSVEIVLEGSDSDNDPLSYSIVAQPSHGTCTMNGDRVQYTPYADYAGDDTFTYKVNDGLTDSNVATVSLHINAVNDLPVAAAGADRTITFGNSVTLDGSGSYDKDGSVTSYLWQEGTQTLSTDASFSKSDFSVGTHTVTLTVTDNEGGVSASDSVKIYVNADQTVVLLPKTAQQQSYYTFDDGYYQKGAVRDFVRDDVGNIVVDQTTGLMWMDDANVAVEREWSDADTFCQESTAGGYSDWRLPEIRTLYFLAKKDSTSVYEDVFGEKIAGKFWSSDISSMTQMASYVDFSDATQGYASTMGMFFISATKAYVRCVRGTPPEFAFTRANDIVTDDIHKLMWQDDTSVTSNNTSLENAIAYCEALTLGGYNDWRVPNVHELYSIVDPSRLNPAINSLFQNVKEDRYWSSTRSTNGEIYTFDFRTGDENRKAATDTGTYVRCVREMQ